MEEIVPLGLAISLLQFGQGGHQRLGDELPAEGPEVAARVREGGMCCQDTAPRRTWPPCLSNAQSALSSVRRSTRNFLDSPRIRRVYFSQSARVEGPGSYPDHRPAFVSVVSARTSSIGYMSGNAKCRSVEATGTPTPSRAIRMCRRRRSSDAWKASSVTRRTKPSLFAS